MIPTSRAAAAYPTRSKWSRLDFAVCCLLFFAILLVLDVMLGNTYCWTSSLPSTGHSGYVLSYALPPVAVHTVEYTDSGDTVLTNRWTWHPVNAVVLAVILCAASIALALAARRLRPGRLLTPLFAGVLASVLVVALAGGLIISRIYWGYWLNPPPIDPRVTGAKAVIGVGGFEAERTERGWKPDLLPADLPHAEKSDPTEYPLEYTYAQLAHLKLPNRPFGELGMSLDAIRRMPLDPKVRVKRQAGYNPDEHLWGFWAEVEGADGIRYLFVAINGAELSNDHHPHYRLLYRRTSAGRLELVSHQVFFWDCAGIEGMDWRAAFACLAVFGAMAAFPLTFLILAVRHIRRARPQSP